MKKSISLILVMVLILGIFSRIGSREEVAEADVLSVSIVVSSTFGDKAFNDSAKEGGELLEAERGLAVDYIECNYEGIKQKLMDAADESDVVVAVGWECYEVAEVAPEYPDVKFILVDTPAEGIENIPNLLSLTYAQNEGAFLAGYIAAKMSDNGIIGAVGGEDSGIVNDFFTGYAQGAKYANPDIVVETAIAGSYSDLMLGRACALELHGKGADVIFNVAGNSGNGIFLAAKESGFYAIGVDADQKLTKPDFDDVIICSMKKDIGRSIYDTIAVYDEDRTWDGGMVHVSDMAAGYISVVYGGENSIQQIDDTLKAEVEELAVKIIAGELKVKSAIK